MFDPFSLWKSMYDYSEENMSTWVDEALQTETFAEWMGQIQSALLQYQKMVHQYNGYLSQTSKSPNSR